MPTYDIHEDIFNEPGSGTAFEPAGQHAARNDEMNLAWQFIAQTGMSVFLTGKAGTGKTTFLKRLRELMPKRMVVLAPTGVAAINAGGQTLHSFFQLPFGPFIPGQTNTRNSGFKMSDRKKDLIRTLDLLVIDEVSMVRADLLDQVDDALRRYRDRTRPFGGVQLLLIGDLMQLAPVAEQGEWGMLKPYYDTPYFFSSHALKQTPYATVELRHIYRQQDPTFIDILGKVRNGQIDAEVLQTLNSRYIPRFTPDSDGWIRLTTHNNTARMYNESRLAAIPEKSYFYKAAIKGEFPEISYPTDFALELKEGAQVMFVKNDPSPEHKYYNGKIGVIASIHNDGIDVVCEDDERIRVCPVEWQNTKFSLDPDTKAIKETVVGTFTQYPLRLAWAITVHKSQGLTFDRAVLDIGASFAHGQAYVALSRCRSLEGMVLSEPIGPGAVITDRDVNQYIDHQREAVAKSIEALPQMKYDYTMALLNEMYSFRPLSDSLGWMTRVVDEYLSSRHADLLQRLKDYEARLYAEITDVAARFGAQYTRAMQESGGNIARSPFATRISDSARYFSAKIDEIFTPVLKMLVISIDNKKVAETYNNAVAMLKNAIAAKKIIFGTFAEEPFTTATYLNTKAKSMLADSQKAAANNRRKERAEKPKKEKKEKPKKEAAPKPKKGDSARKTYELYRQGISIADIAAERQLAESTIFAHLASMVDEGLLTIDDIVSPDHQVLIRRAVASFTEAFTTADVKAKLPDYILPGEILAIMRHDKSNY